MTSGDLSDGRTPAATRYLESYGADLFQSRVTLGVAEGREVLRSADQDCVQGDLQVDAVIEVVQSDHSVTLCTASSGQQYLQS